MADAKISALSAISTIATDDVLPIVDTSETATKKISLSQIAGQINYPYITQCDTADQYIASTTVAQVITFDTDVYKSGIARTTSSRFTVSEAGTYFISFSAVVASTLANKVLNIWLKKNSVDVSWSNTIYTFKSTNSTAIITVTYIEQFTAGQYFELWMWGDDLGVRLESTPAAGSPTRPGCPGIILTANRISN